MLHQAIPSADPGAASATPQPATVAHGETYVKDGRGEEGKQKEAAARG